MTSGRTTATGMARRCRSGGSPKKPRSFWKELPLLIGIALVLALLIKTFLVQAFSIPSESMMNTLQRGDRVLVDKLTPWFGSEPERGEVVVFHDPGGWLEGQETPTWNVAEVPPRASSASCPPPRRRTSSSGSSRSAATRSPARRAARSSSTAWPWTRARTLILATQTEVALRELAEETGITDAELGPVLLERHCPSPSTDAAGTRTSGTTWPASAGPRPSPAPRPSRSPSPAARGFSRRYLRRTVSGPWDGVPYQTRRAAAHAA
ncbi:hypothetical protein SALBM135S_07410 [Streptomyces alboniger]